MTGRILPNLGLKAFYTTGESGWGDDMSLNMLKLSVITQGGVLGMIDPLPGSPNAGDVYVVTTVGANQNDVAVYDNGAWVYFTPQEGWMLYDKGTSEYISFNGSTWSALSLGNGEANEGGGGSSSPDVTGTPVALPALSAFTPFNVSAATMVDHDNGPISITSPATSGDNNQGIEQAVPGSTPWALTVKLDITLWTTSAYQGAGIYVRDASGKFITLGLGMQASTTFEFVTQHWNSPTSFNANLNTTQIFSGRFWWMRIENDGTNFNYSVSPNGADWLPYYSEAITAFIGTPEAAGVLVNNTGGRTGATAVWSFELTEGVGTDSTWPTPSSGGGGTPNAARVLLQDLTVTAGASADLTDFDNTKYLHYEIEISGIQATNALTVTMSSDGGVTYDTSAVYNWATTQWGSGGYDAANHGENDTQINLNSGNSNAPATTAGTLKLYDPGNGATHKQVSYDASTSASDGHTYMMVTAGTYKNIAAVNAVRYAPTAGTVTGRFRLYGIPIVNGAGGGSGGGSSTTKSKITGRNVPLAAQFPTYRQFRGETGTGSFIDNNAGLSLAIATPSTTGGIAAMRPIPSGDQAAFEFEARFVTTPLSNNSQSGIVLGDGTGNLTFFGFFNRGGSALSLNVQNCWQQGGSWNDGSFFWEVSPTFFFKMVVTGTALALYGSGDGENWVNWGVGHDFGVPFTEYGFYVAGSGYVDPSSTAYFSSTELPAPVDLSL